MPMFTIPVTTSEGRRIAVTVLATDERSAVLLAKADHEPTCSEAMDALDLIQHAEYKDLWPTWARLNLAMAANTLGPLPPYAHKRVKDAMKAAVGTERRLARQAEQAEQVLANLPASERSKVNA